MTDRPAPPGDAPAHPSPPSRGARACALAFLAVLGVVHLAPLSLHPATWSPAIDADVHELMWRLEWTVHALTTPGVKLLDANTLYPDEGTYATMDYVVGLAPLAAPLTWLSSNPLLVYNATAFLSLGLAALGAYLLARAVGARPAAAVLAGAIYAFNPVHVARLGQINVLATHWLPFLVLLAHRLYQDPRPRRAALLALVLLWAVITSGYQAVFAAGTLGWTAVVLTVAAGRRARRPALLVAAAIVVAGIGFAPVGRPYIAGAVERDRVRTIADVRGASPTAESLLLMDSSFHEALRRRLDPDGTVERRARGHLFPGLVAPLAALAGLALLLVHSGRRAWAVVLAPLAVAGFLLSLGTNLPGYETAFELLPPLSMVRAPSRFTLVGLLGLGVLASVAAEALSARIGRRFARAAWLAGPLLCLLHLGETARPRGIDAWHFDPPPAVYDWLADQPGDFAIVELPTDWQLNGFYLVYSTYHWKRLVNGYHGSFISPYSKSLLFRRIPSFPRADAIDALLEVLGLRYVVVHPDPDPEKFRLKGHGHARLALAEALTDLPPTLREVWSDEHASVLELVEPNYGTLGLTCRRVARGADLAGHRLRFQSRGLRSLLDVGEQEIVVHLNGLEVARFPAPRRYRTFTLDIPGHALVTGVNEIEFRSAYSAPAEALDDAAGRALALGDTGVTLAAEVSIRADGDGSRPSAALRVNGREVIDTRRGYDLVLLDPASGAVLDTAWFDTWGRPSAADKLADYVERLPDGAVVAAVAGGRAWQNLDDRAVRALASLGAGVDPRRGRIGAHALVGVKGAAPGTALERAGDGRILLEHGTGGPGPDPLLPPLSVRRVRIE